MGTKMSGISLGVVVDIDDPSGFKRVRVRIPELHGSVTIDPYLSYEKSKPNRIEDNAIPWALVSYPFGTDITPELNQVVSVGFMNGNPNNPIVLGWLGYEYTNVEEALEPKTIGG